MSGKDFTKDQLEVAAQELNKVLELNPQIPTSFSCEGTGAKAVAVAKEKYCSQLKTDLADTGTCLEPEDLTTGKIKTETIAILKAVVTDKAVRGKLGWDKPAAAPAPKKSTKGKKDPAPKDEKKDEKKSSKPKAEKKAPAPKKEAAKKDEFGFREGSNASLFCKMVKDAGKDGLTMDDVKKAKWNTNGATYFGTLSAMKKLDHAKVVDGKIHYVK